MIPLRKIPPAHAFSCDNANVTVKTLFTEVKPCLTELISGWVTIWIDFLSYTPWTSITPSTSTTNVVCGLSFSRSDLVELRPSQSSLRLRERAISRSDITNRAVQAHSHIEIAIARATARYEPKN